MNLDIKSEQYFLKLPFDHPKTPGITYDNSSVNFSFDRRIFEFLSGQSREERGSFLIAALAALIYRYTGQNEVPISYSLYERSGKFWNSIKAEVLGELQFNLFREKLSYLMADRPEPRNQINQVFLILDELQEVDNHTAESWRTIENQSTDLEVDLKIIVLQNHHSTILRVEYNSNSFLQNTIQQIGKHFENLLLGVIDREKTTIADLKLFTEEEEDWYNNLSHVRHRGIFSMHPHEEVEIHATTNPSKIAVSSKSESITYGSLNSRSNQLAHYLLKQGAKPESRVIVCLEPTVDIAVALLAILKIGATYVPMNPSHPEYRIKKIIEDVNPDMMVTDSASKEVLNFGDFLSITINTAELDLEDKENPNVVIDPTQTAYIYYTSGTTGLPKGSLGSYGNLNHYLRVSQEKYGFNNKDVMPALASYSFSISMFELMSPLLAGGTLVILDRADILDAEIMVEMLQNLTFVHAGPSLLKSLVKYIHANIDDYSVFNGLRHLSSGGDMVPPDLLRNLQLIFRNTELYVIYGCSEIACMGFTFRVDPIIPIEKTYVGKPFENVALLLLDKEGKRVPVGVSGEVCIGGHGVAVGYLNRPELTEEKFFVFGDTRFYRTGDVGRLNNEGNLELLGREDFQIQIHGMRVELGEVEYHLRNIPAVRDAVVVARPHGKVENTLVAFYVRNGSYRLAPESLRKYMAQHLPDYMVPSFYIQLESLPLNVNMKVDRTALIKQDLSFIHSGRKPETESEVTMAKIWQELLGIDQVGLYDNFLAIGGDSLKAMELINKVNEIMGVKLNGLDILRESLQVLAANCDDKFGKVSTEVESDKRDYQNLSINRIESFFFGKGSELYGLFHPAAGNSKSAAVLVCPPIGGEYKRCCFLLKILADSVSSLGTPIMRFDYYGTGDSYGNCIEATMERWISDVEQAHDELIRRTGCRNITVLAVRFGALLACNALGRLNNVNWVLWDPILKGNNYYSRMREMHRTKVLRSKVFKNIAKPRLIEGGEELMGSTYSDMAINQMRQLSIEIESKDENFRLLMTKTEDSSKPLSSDTSSANTIEHLNLDVGWYNQNKIGAAITDNQILDRLLSLISKSIL